jgi:hypothetical protein
MKKRYGALLFILAMALAVVAGMMLVQNRQNAVSQAKQIVANDEAGTDVTNEMIKLKAYAATHMKVNVKYVLTGSYNRAAAEAKARASNSSAVYAAAQASCDKRGVDSIRQSQCVASYIAAQGQPAPDVKLPDTAKYTYQEIGPAWSFDMPGLLFVVSGVLAVVAIVSVVHRVVTK